MSVKLKVRGLGLDYITTVVLILKIATSFQRNDHCGQVLVVNSS